MPSQGLSGVPPEVAEVCRGMSRPIWARFCAEWGQESDQLPHGRYASPLGRQLAGAAEDLAWLWLDSPRDPRPCPTNPPLHPTAFPAIHPVTIAALGLLVLALEVQPEDMADLAAYGNIPEHLADVIDDIEISDED